MAGIKEESQCQKESNLVPTVEPNQDNLIRAIAMWSAALCAADNVSNVIARTTILFLPAGQGSGLDMLKRWLSVST